ncbi:hypothetical protein Hamer_G007643, partial [Homarus americanus]
STWRKIQELGLSTQYNVNVEFRLFCGMVGPLAFLSLEDVIEGMRYLKNVIPQDPPEAEELLSSQLPLPSDTLMPLRMRHTSPMFAPHLWNVHDATMNNNARTNNICVGWNNKFFNLDAVGNPPQRRVRRRHVQLQERHRNLCVARRRITRL